MKKILYLLSLLVFMFSGYSQSAKKYYNKGNEKAYLHDYTGAIADYSEAIKKNPKYSDAYYKRGRSRLEIENWGEAILDFNSAIKIKPDWSEAYIYRGIAKVSLQESYKIGNEHIPEIPPNLQSVKKQETYDANTERLRKVMQKNANDSALYLKKRKEQKACPFFDTSKDAVKGYSKAIKKNPMDAHAYISLGRIKMIKEDYSGAIADFSRALEINPMDTNTYLLRGNAKRTLQDYIGAVNDYTKVIEIDTGMAIAYFARGGARSQLKDTDAIADFIKAIKINPLLKWSIAFLPASEHYKTSAYYKKDYSGAIADFNKAIEINPGNAEAYYRRGLVQIKSGLTESGCLDFRRAEQLGDKRASDLLKECCK